MPDGPGVEGAVTSAALGVAQGTRLRFDDGVTRPYVLNCPGALL